MIEQATVGKSERQATRLVFLVVGFLAAAWACLVPFAKANTELDEGTLGLVLLCLGVGSILAMPTAGALSTRYGCRVVLTTSSLVACAALPLLATVSSAALLAVVLFVFGAALGSADCVMNVQAVIVERAGAKPMMSGFHAFYSLGGIVGAVSISLLLMLGATPLNSMLVALAAMILAVLIAYPGLLRRGNPTEGPAFAIPRGIVLALGVLCFIVFLVEGSMLDWSPRWADGPWSLLADCSLPAASRWQLWCQFARSRCLGTRSSALVAPTLCRCCSLLWGDREPCRKR
jgi:MFS family permease